MLHLIGPTAGGAAAVNAIMQTGPKNDGLNLAPLAIALLLAVFIVGFCVYLFLCDR